MTKTIQDAYRIVYNDILNKDISLFLGKYDAVHGNIHFMNGISTVMEFIAGNVSEQDREDFLENFCRNILNSQDECKKFK